MRACCWEDKARDLFHSLLSCPFEPLEAIDDYVLSTIPRPSPWWEDHTMLFQRDLQAATRQKATDGESLVFPVQFVKPELSVEGLHFRFPGPCPSGVRGLPNTWIEYFISKTGNAELNIYNLNGELVRTLQSGYQQAGKYSVEWNGLNNKGNLVNPGIYFYRLQTADYIGTKKMFLVR